MKNTRRHKRYGVDSADVRGQMTLTEKVEIIDISLGGVALKADRRLNPGREYTIKLQDKGKTITLTGIIVRSELSGIATKENGETVSVYTAGMQFKEESSSLLAGLLKSLAENKAEPAPAPGDRRQNVRLQITYPNQNVLTYPAHFKVKIISLSGMLIRTDQPLENGSRVPMGLFLSDSTSVNFTGRVVSCERKDDEGQIGYEIGSEFIDLTDKDKAVLQLFINQWEAFEKSSNPPGG